MSFEDGHSSQVIPVPIPNTEVKLVASRALVSNKRQNTDAVFVIFSKMNTKLSKIEAQNKINSFFEKSDFKPEQLKKIKRLAMKFNIKLGDKKKFFCKKCLHPLAGKLSITKTHKTIECKYCGFKNKVKIV